MNFTQHSANLICRANAKQQLGCRTTQQNVSQPDAVWKWPLANGVSSSSSNRELVYARPKQNQNLLKIRLYYKQPKHTYITQNVDSSHD